MDFTIIFALTGLNKEQMKYSLVLIIILICCLQSCERISVETVRYPYLCFINESDDTIWTEIIAAQDMSGFYGRSNRDSFFYGEVWEHSAVNPHSMKRYEVLYEDSQMSEPFVFRIMFVDSFPTCYSIRYADNIDSLKIVEDLKAFENNHLLYKRWYSKDDLDHMNWTIIYPSKY